MIDMPHFLFLYKKIALNEDLSSTRTRFEWFLLTR